MSKRERDCQASRRDIDGHIDVMLVCFLPEGHDGPHYDEADDLTWKDGKPGD